MSADPIRRASDRIVGLFAHPGGPAARPMAMVLNFFNRPSGGRAAEAVGVCPGQRVLEVGFGGGAAIPSTLRALEGEGQLCAVDLSHDMVALGARRFTIAVDHGLLTLLCADVSALPFRDEAFDSAYALHSHMYWPSVLAGISEIRRVLAPGGRLLLGMDVVAGIPLLQRFGLRHRPETADQVADRFAEAGFVDVVRQPLVSGVVSVTGVRP